MDAQLLEVGVVGFAADQMDPVLQRHVQTRQVRRPDHAAADCQVVDKPERDRRVARQVDADPRAGHFPQKGAIGDLGLASEESEGRARVENVQCLPAELEGDAEAAMDVVDRGSGVPQRPQAGQEGVDVRVVVEVATRHQPGALPVAVQSPLHLEGEVGVLVGLLVQVQVVGDLHVDPEGPIPVTEGERDDPLVGLRDVAEPGRREAPQRRSQGLAPELEGLPPVGGGPRDHNLVHEVVAHLPGQRARPRGRSRPQEPVGVQSPALQVSPIEERAGVHRRAPCDTNRCITSTMLAVTAGQVKLSSALFRPDSPRRHDRPRSLSRATRRAVRVSTSSGGTR